MLVGKDRVRTVSDASEHYREPRQPSKAATIRDAYAQLIRGGHSPADARKMLVNLLGHGVYEALRCSSKRGRPVTLPRCPTCGQGVAEGRPTHMAIATTAPDRSDSA